MRDALEIAAILGVATLAADKHGTLSSALILASSRTTPRTLLKHWTVALILERLYARFKDNEEFLNLNPKNIFKRVTEMFSDRASRVCFMICLYITVILRTAQGRLAW